jgi:hypothetical protein
VHTTIYTLLGNEAGKGDVDAEGFVVAARSQELLSDKPSGNRFTDPVAVAGEGV